MASPTVKSAIAAQQRRRGGKRSASRPPTSIPTPYPRGVPEKTAPTSRGGQWSSAWT